MYERMLNKLDTPMFEEMIYYCGENGREWTALDTHLREEYKTSRQIRFPYGNQYGWCATYRKGRKHICDVFAEKNAFTAFFRLADVVMETIIHDVLSAYARSIWEKRYPCGEGGWLEYRVTKAEHLGDLKKIIAAKITVRAK